MNMMHLKWGCLAIAVSSFSVMMVLLWNSSGMGLQSSDQVDDGSSRQTIINHPLIVERDGERIIWRLHAQSAQQQDRGMLLQQPMLELFTGSGNIANIRSQRAWFNPIKRDIDFREQVSVDYLDWHLNTERLIYLSRDDAAFIPGVFTAKSSDSNASGRELRADRITEKVHIAHDVRVHDLQYTPTISHN